MRIPKRKPITVGEMLKTEFMEPYGLTNQQLANAMGVHRNTVSTIINGGSLSAPNAIKLGCALGNTPDFWLNLQHMTELWTTRNSYQSAAKGVHPLDLCPA